MLTSETRNVEGDGRARSRPSETAPVSVDRRNFLRGSGLAIGGLAAMAATGSNKAEAREFWARAMSADPDNETLRETLARLNVEL